ncbi:MAG: ABC transporter permease, partial [Rhizobiaceae bacterium]|nr:ABC transporter permease [Rhizobiaceae bacterium]
MMKRRIHPLLIVLTTGIFFFLLAPLVIIIGSSFSDTSYLTFPPRGLTLHWFWNIFEIEAFRTTAITSFELAFLGTTLSLLVGIPAAYALNRYRLELPSWLSTLFVLPILIPEIVFGFS